MDVLPLLGLPTRATFITLFLLVFIFLSMQLLQLSPLQLSHMERLVKVVAGGSSFLASSSGRTSIMAASLRRRSTSYPMTLYFTGSCMGESSTEVTFSPRMKPISIMRLRNPPWPDRRTMTAVSPFFNSDSFILFHSLGALLAPHIFACKNNFLLPFRQ